MMSVFQLFKRNEAPKKRFFSRWLAVLAACILTGASAGAQQSQTPYEIAGKSMNYYPASVEAASLFRRTPDDVDYARGRVTVRIPLYTIQTRNFTLPISLSYTTGGIKADQKSGRIGLGWQLEAEPMISREIRGIRDEQSYLRDSSYYAEDPLAFRALAGAGTHDIMPDLFHFRTLSSSGRFILKMADQYRFNPRILNPEQVELSVPGNRVSGWFDNEINLTDNRGNRYSYGADGNSREVTRQGNGIRTVTAWKIAGVTALDGETLSFRYKEYQNGERSKSNYDYYGFEDMDDSNLTSGESVPPYPGYWKGVDGYENYYHYEKDVRASDGSDSAVFKKWFYNPSPSGKVYAPLDVIIDLRLIESIEFPNGSVSFAYSDTDQTLQTITVRNSAGATIRQIRFTRHSEGYDRHLLDAVEIRDAAGGTVEKYGFDYYPLPAGAQAFSPYTKAVDYWGYFNGHTENTDLVPRQTIEFRLSNNATKRTVTIGGGINKEASFEHTRAYSLSSVRYPTGGKTTFHYELNRMLTPIYGPYDAGGLRIASIVDETPGAEAVVRSFTYRPHGTGWEGTGSMRFPLADWLFVQKMKKHYLVPIHTSNSFHTATRDYRVFSPVNKLCPDMDVYYEEVTETTGNSRTKHIFDNYLVWPSSYFYEEGDFAERFYEPMNNGDNLTSGGTHEYYQQGDSLVKQVSDGRRLNDYDGLFEMEKTAQIENQTSLVPGDKALEELYGNSFREKHAPMRIVTTEYGGSVTTTYTDDGPVSESVNYTVDSNGAVTEKSVRADDGSDDTVEYTYPSESMEEPYRSMARKRDVSTPLEEHYYHNGVLKKKIRRIYADAPAGTSSRKGYELIRLQETGDEAGAVFEDVETYDRFLPTGQPLQFTRRDGTVVSLIWSHEYQHLAAIVENASWDEVSRYFTTDPVALAASSVCSDSTYGALEALREQLPQASVTVFRYIPLTGIRQITAPDGRKTYYEYDAAGRLYKEIDNEEQILNTYDYVQKNF